mgnify:CR=1 FL=1
MLQEIIGKILRVCEVNYEKNNGAIQSGGIFNRG